MGFCVLQNDAEIALGNCQLYIYGAYALGGYTFVETVVIVHEIFRANFFHGFVMLGTILMTGKILYRFAMYFIVKIFMNDLGRPSCTCSHTRANHTAVAE